MTFSHHHCNPQTEWESLAKGPQRHCTRGREWRTCYVTGNLVTVVVEYDAPCRVLLIVYNDIFLVYTFSVDSRQVSR